MNEINEIFEGSIKYNLSQMSPEELKTLYGIVKLMGQEDGPGSNSLLVSVWIRQEMEYQRRNQTPTPEQPWFVVQPKQFGGIYSYNPAGAAHQVRDMLAKPDPGEVLHFDVWEEGPHGEAVGDPIEVVVYGGGEGAMPAAQWERLQEQVRTLERPNPRHVSHEIRSAIGALSEIETRDPDVQDHLRNIMLHLQWVDEIVGSLPEAP